MFGFSLAVLLVEKGQDWPVTILTKPLKWILGKIYSKLEEMISCTVCTAFWATLVGEIVLKLWYTHIFMWPFTGVIALGLTWLVIDFLNAIDKTQK
jgi:hypothetical protein